MSLQDNTLVVGFHRQGVYQPYYFSFVGMTVFIWLVSVIVISGELLYVVIAILTFILITVSSLPVFYVWKYTTSRRIGVFISSYVVWALLSPIVWAAGNHFLLKIYAIVITAYGIENMQYQVTLWSMLNDLLHSTFTATVFTGLFFYISIWMTVNLMNAKYIQFIAKVLSALSGVLYVLLFVISIKK